MKNIIFILFFFGVYLKIIAQTPILPEKCIYKDTNGYIYVNKSLPLYFKISQSPSPTAEHKLLISHTTPQYTNPLYLAKEGENIFYSPYAVDTVTKKVVSPKRYVVFELYGDGTAPTVKIHNNTTAYEKSDTLFFGDGLKIWFTATDKVAGVDKIYLSVNGNSYEEYLSDTLEFEHGTFNILKYYATDKVGNYSQIDSVSFFIDTTRPITNLVIIGNHKDNIVASNCKVSLKPQDAFSGNAKTYYYIDNQAKKIYTKPIAIGNLREGRHILHYYSQDNVQNTETQKSYEFYIDKTAPIVLSEVVGDYIMINGKAYTSGRSQIQLSAIDNKAGVDKICYSFDKKNWQKYEQPFFLPDSIKNVQVYYYAVDNVGNMDKSNIQATSGSENLFFSELDLTPPKINYSVKGKHLKLFDTLYINNQTRIFLSAFDTQSGVQNITYQVDNQPITGYQKSFSISKHGQHKITVTAFDNVNNMSDIDFFLKVDTIPPEIFCKFSSPSFQIDGQKVYPQGTKMYIAATDNSTGVYQIYYSINNSSERLYSTFLTFNQKGKYTVKIRTVDLLGNENVENFSFEIR